MHTIDLRLRAPNHYRLVVTARDEVHALPVEPHYRTRGRGVGGRPRGVQ
jgi:hypothetical protein